MPSDAICVLHTQIPREPRTEPNEPRFRKILLGLVSVYWLLISVRSRSRPRSKKPDRYRFEPPNRYRAPSSLGSFAGLCPHINRFLDPHSILIMDNKISMIMLY